ncbi:hypothetical protein ANRL1_02432 [Anaerolineae bacterium]|nr:hypothetical protein ANRL1_02432 [Anaerolineae bacterium]
MIVLDEEIYDLELAARIAVWYAGRVISITTLRPKTIIKDDIIPTLLCSASRPTFVTINGSDFWRIVSADPRYAIVCVDLPAWRVMEIPDWLQRALRMPDFRSKHARMGKVIRLRPSHIEYYESDRRVCVIEWRK